MQIKYTRDKRFQMEAQRGNADTPVYTSAVICTNQPNNITTAIIYTLFLLIYTY